MDWSEIFGVTVSLVVRGSDVPVSGEYRTVTEALILVGTLIGWNVLIDWLTFRFPRLQHVLEPPPLMLIENGRVLWRHLRHEFMSEGELKTKLR